MSSGARERYEPGTEVREDPSGRSRLADATRTDSGCDIRLEPDLDRAEFERSVVDREDALCSTWRRSSYSSRRVVASARVEPANGDVVDCHVACDDVA